jgi:hypothetical protein
MTKHNRRLSCGWTSTELIFWFRLGNPFCRK